MGTDIHTYVEHKVLNKWRMVGEHRGALCIYCDGESDYDDCYCHKGRSWRISRDMVLFGLLAGLRTSDFPVKPKGLPEDISKGALRCKSEDEGHTSSYYTLEELIKISQGSTRITGYLDLHEYILYVKNGYPNFWLGESGFIRNYKIISEEEMERRRKLVSFSDNEHLMYAKVTWDQPHNKIGRDLWERIMPRMLELEKDPTKIRLVFWFDN